MIKRILAALPTKPLVSIALQDADSTSALLFVQQKLRDADLDASLSNQQMAELEKLGGRVSDLETVCDLFNSGQKGKN